MSVERCPLILGYASRRSVRAGERIDFFVSSKDSDSYNAQIVRIISPDIGPIGPAFKQFEIDAPLNGPHQGKFQPILPGSYADISGPLPIATEFAIDLLVYPTLLNSRTQVIIEISSNSGSVLEVNHSSETGLTARLSQSGEIVCTTSINLLRERMWREIRISIDPSKRIMTLNSNPISNISQMTTKPQQSTGDWKKDFLFEWHDSSIKLAARKSPLSDRHDPSSTFNGKIERLRLFSSSNPAQSQTPIAEWDFSLDIPSNQVTDIGKYHLDGTLHNMPTRGIRGSKWSGNTLSWVQEPESYAAIHFHEDDVADAKWQLSHHFQVPEELASGCYALRLSPTSGESPDFYVPFFVRPMLNKQNSKVAYLIPTTTYGAYANMNLRVTAQFNELAHGRLTVLDSTDFLLLTMPELGKSTYDVHNDGSPVLYSSMNRPVTNFRPNGRIYKFCLDLMIVDWFDSMNIGVDIITDDDIHHEGLDSLKDYTVLVTSTHPEYITHAQSDAIRGFTESGGRLMYLGGNGFYTAAEISSTDPDIVEVRRPGQDNLWRVDHTEGVFSTSGLPGGLWRNLGRSENGLVGVGFITQGFDECTFYRRNVASKDPRLSWIFEGIGFDELIGNFGILQGGAAGYEIDRHDFARGSPPQSVVVASSSNHSPLYGLMVSSILDTLPQTGDSQDPIRADMVFFETNNGGAVFSVGSIAWAGSLSHNNYDNNVSRLTLNVLQRFLDKQNF
ncbi:MAG: hypothetical protein HQ486_08060 [Acidimicrobiaceae bacterium]|nr:hypothetical protein [Acidimicrobiaceae bacterium]